MTSDGWPTLDTPPQKPTPAGIHRTLTLQQVDIVHKHTPLYHRLFIFTWGDINSDMVPVMMETKVVKVGGRPSSPREFFQRLYGDAEEKNHHGNTSASSSERRSNTAPAAEIVTPVPILANPIPFFLPGASEAQLTAAAAGLSAFCKPVFYFCIIEKYIL